MQTLELLHARRSCRAFLPTPLSKEHLETILAAGKAAPMGRKQPVHLSVIESPALLTQIDKALADAFGNPELHPLYGATALVVASYQKDVEEKLGVANTACAVENMLLAATDLGVGNIFLWSANFVFPGNPDLAAACGIPADYIPISSAGLGYTEEEVQTPATPKCEITVSYH